MGERFQLQIGIDESGNDADFRKTEPDGKEVNAVLHEERDDVAILVALGIKEIGQLVHLLVQLQISNRTPAFNLNTCRFVRVFAQLKYVI